MAMKCMNGEMVEICNKCGKKVYATFETPEEWELYHATGWCKACIKDYLSRRAQL